MKPNALYYGDYTPREGEAEFDEDHSRGKAGEALFVKEFAGVVMRTDGRCGDFVYKCKDTQLSMVIELKTDYITNLSTVMIETFSDREKRLPGGPWKAIDDGAWCYCILRVATKTLWFFSSHALRQWVIFNRRRASAKRPFQVRNKGYTTEGFVFPYRLLNEVAISTWKMGDWSQKQRGRDSFMQMVARECRKHAEAYNEHPGSP